ncbi:molybdenum ABC transporter ATP-binding protein [Thermaurantiacus sp.]
MMLALEARDDAPIPLAAHLEVAPGEVLALVGPSGAGKTTLLRTVAGLHRPAAGRVVVRGTTWLDTARGIDRPAHRRRVGLVFQGYALFPHMSARGNVMVAMDTPDRGEAERLLGMVGLAGLADRRPSALSGGQQQRVALARALARRPDVLLLDEPFAALDRATRDELQAGLLARLHGLAIPVVLVTHDLGEAQRLADRMVVLDRGRTVAAGAPGAVLADPQAIRTLGLRELSSLLPARLVAHLPDGLSALETEAGPLLLPRVAAAPGSRVDVRVLAHEVILARGRPEGLSALNILSGTVARIVPGEGPGVIVHVAVGTRELLARITRRAADRLALRPGEPVAVILKALSVAREQVARGRSDATGPA